MKQFNKVAIVGIGLIGGSLALDLRRKRLAREIIGISRHKKTIHLAKRMGAIDRGGQDLGLLKDADLIILAAPVDVIVQKIKTVFRLAKKGCIIFDVGGTKQEIIKAAQNSKKRGVNFIGTHPLAGAEKRGINHAQPGLFKGSLCILTPARQTNKHTLSRVRALWMELGAKTAILTPGEHDRILTYTSHLPHLMAFSLISSVPVSYLRFAASGLKDTTRIAASDAALWQAIFLSNKGELLQAVEKFQKHISLLKSAIRRKDRKTLSRLLLRAKHKRESL